MLLKFRAFRAVDNTVLSERYLEGHGQVLRDYGITNITSNNKAWLDNPSIYCIIAENEEGGFEGGIRVQLADGIHPLPVEKAIGHIDPKIYQLVANYQPVGAGELSALWNSKAVAGRGISVFLTRAGISITNQINCNILLGICGDYTLKMFRNVGFVVDKTLGNNGEFLYPKDDFIARVLGILNAKNLKTAADEDRIRMLDLRKNPVQRVEELGPKGSVLIDYNLIFESAK
jgi:hypothetical protein